jgi:hypothetical protein
MNVTRVNSRVLEMELPSEQYNGTGLRVAYLSGKHSAELYQNAKAAAAAGAHHEDDVDTLRAFADDPSITDLFLSNEWPQGILAEADLSVVPEGIDRMTTGSTISAELAKELKPRVRGSLLCS